MAYRYVMNVTLFYHHRKGYGLDRNRSQQQSSAFSRKDIHGLSKDATCVVDVLTGTYFIFNDDSVLVSLRDISNCGKSAALDGS